MERLRLAKRLAAQFSKYKPGVAVKNILYLAITRERRKYFGPENDGKTIYVIRSIADRSPFYIGPVHNLLANYFYVLSHIQYARLHGWIPVVDELNYPVYNSQKTPVNGTCNPWEYFWKQPGGITLDEAYRSKNVVLSKQSWYGEWDMGYDTSAYRDKARIDFYNALAKSAELNRTTQDYVNLTRKKIMPLNGRVLGVNVRIGGHARQALRHGAGHPIQPELDELLNIARRRKNEWGMEFIFLASDVELAVKRFQEVFGNELITYPRQRAGLGTEYGLDKDKQIYAPGHSHQTALDYLTEMELLSGCSAIIGSVTSGFRYAVIVNGNRYEHIEVLDYGRFEDGRLRRGRFGVL